jgi:hypothetical protein
MDAEFVRRGIGLVILLAATMWIGLVKIERARLSLWVWAFGFVLTLA